MGGLVAEGIKNVISIKIKVRQDGYTDQYNRIFMTKMCILASIIVGVNYYKDKVKCIVPSKTVNSKYVGSTCWIQGFYVFQELQNRMKESGYYGIPRNMDYDGMDPLGKLCSTVDRALEPVENCEPMTKVYYLQYQYMPFFLAALALTYYLPYIVFVKGNEDLVSLKDAMKSGSVDAGEIVDDFFDYEANKKMRAKCRVLMKIAVKVLYLISNAVTLLAIDYVLHGKYVDFGSEWATWNRLDHGLRHSHDLRLRDTAKPGNILLPTMGLCEIHEASRDIRNTVVNRHRYICEISPHVLYQYVLAVFWFFVVVGFFVSSFGLLICLLEYVHNLIGMKCHSKNAENIHSVTTLREQDYLKYIRRKNIPIYGQVIRKLIEKRISYTSLPNNDDGL